MADRYNMLERKLWAWKAEGKAPIWIHPFPFSNASAISQMKAMADDPDRAMQALLGEHGYTVFRVLLARYEGKGWTD